MTESGNFSLKSFTNFGLKDKFGTKYPSMISIWNLFVPARITAWILCVNSKLLTSNIDGAITNAGSGLSKNGSTISPDNSITANTLQGSNGNVNFGGSFTIPKITYNNTGHITEVGTTTVTLPTNPNTDTKVTQTVTTNNVTYPILLAPNGQTDTTTTTTYFDSGVTLNPSTNTITANITGNANTASSCIGNSKTATNLQTTRNFAISGGATSTSVAFNGSSNVTLNVTSLNTDYLNNGSNTLVLNCGASL